VVAAAFKNDIATCPTLFLRFGESKRTWPKVPIGTTQNLSLVWVLIWG